MNDLKLPSERPETITFRVNGLVRSNIRVVQQLINAEVGDGSGINDSSAIRLALAFAANRPGTFRSYIRSLCGEANTTEGK